MAEMTELARLAAAVNVLRPDWPTASVQTYLRESQSHRDYAELAVALVVVALNPANVTPKRLAGPGIHWRAAQVASGNETPLPEHFDRAQIEADRARRSADPSVYIDEIRESLRRRFGDETAPKVGAE